MSEPKVELIFIPSFGPSHIIPTLQLAKHLLNHHHRFDLTFLLIPPPPILPTPLTSLDSEPNIRFISLPATDLPPPGTEPGVQYFVTYIQNYHPVVKQTITQLTSDSPNSARLILDMFTSSMIDVGNELGFPSYLYFTSGASSLGLFFTLPTLDSEVTTEFIDYSPELDIPSYVNPLPTLSLPSVCFNRSSSNYKGFLATFSRYREVKGIIVNSFAELELQAVRAFDGLIENIPRVYLVGPMLDLEGKPGKTHSESQIMNWLNKQPEESVLFICFGSKGSMSEEQVKEIAYGLERSGQRFLWSIRRRTLPGSPISSDYANLEEVLPDGFLERVGEKGLVCGWAPQVEVLAHKAIRGFVSHCGWNSTLESVWFGVPMVTWPLDAEQRQNAFQLVKDLGLAVEIREGYYRKEGDDLVVADEVERGLKAFVESESEMRRKMKEMSVKARKALMEGGSSLSTLNCLVEELTKQL